MASLSSLLAKGYFPRELPPPFGTATYARHVKKLVPLWKKGTWTRCAAHNLARPGGLRRPLKIPNPFSYFALAEIIASNWAAIRQHTWAQRLSASRPHLVKSSGRAVVPRYHYGELTRLRALRRRAGRYLLMTDIDQFYPSIYTHAIPWALHTKAVAKATVKAGKGAKGPSLLGDLLDTALRNTNDGQTQGIPIGPDTSLVIAEILLAAADKELIGRASKTLSGHRYVDDYELSFDNLSSAEQALSDLQAILAGLELLVNPRKTRIVDFPTQLDDEWVIDIKAVDLRSTKTPIGQRNDVLGLFSKAFDWAKRQPSESVLRYAVARVQGMTVSATAWRAFHNCVLGAAAADPSTLPVALGTLFMVAQRSGLSVPQAPLGEVFDSVVLRHAPRAQGSEVAWALWGALAWNVSLSVESAKAIDAMEDDVVALLALHANAKGLFPANALTAAKWATLAAQPDALESDHWLLAYEANQHGWLPAPSVAKNTAFAAMSKAQVRFYDPAKVKPQFPNAARRIPGGTLPWDYA